MNEVAPPVSLEVGRGIFVVRTGGRPGVCDYRSMNIDDLPHRFRLIVECEVEVTDMPALQAAQIAEGIDEHGEVDVQIPTSFP
jgi:hypothetical protein